MYIVCIIIHYADYFVRSLVGEVKEQAAAVLHFVKPVSHPYGQRIADVIHAVAVGSDEEFFAFSVGKVCAAAVRLWCGRSNGRRL